jgi:hypothetical protein
MIPYHTAVQKTQFFMPCRRVEKRVFSVKREKKERTKTPFSFCCFFSHAGCLLPVSCAGGVTFFLCCFNFKEESKYPNCQIVVLACLGQHNKILMYLSFRSAGRKTRVFCRKSGRKHLVFLLADS